MTYFQQDRMATELRTLAQRQTAVLISLSSGVQLAGYVVAVDATGGVAMNLAEGCALVSLEAVEALQWDGHWSEPS